MKFKLTTEHLYWWPIPIELPDPDKPGKWQTQSFTMQFASVSSDAAAAMAKEIENLPTEEERLARQHDSLIRAAKDWRDVVDDDGRDVPFTEEALRMLLQTSWGRVGVYRAYAKSLVKGAARQGN